MERKRRWIIVAAGIGTATVLAILGVRGAGERVVIPTPTLTPTPGEMCGGIAGLECPGDMICRYEGGRGPRFPDDAGVCIPRPRTTKTP